MSEVKQYKFDLSVTNQPPFDEWLVLKSDYDKKCAELDEQLRLNGIGQQRELKLMTEIESLKKRLLDFENSIPVDDVRKLVDSLRGNHSSYPCLNTDSKCVVCMALEQFTAKHGSKLNKGREK